MSVSCARSRLFHRAMGRTDRQRKYLIPWALAGFALLVCHLACAGPAGTTPGTPLRPLNVGFGIAPNWDGGLTLTPTEQQVSLVAWQNGDRKFLMVDKVRGKIILFEDGRPVFSRPALTGASMADRIPPDEWNMPWALQTNVRYKVTPAGRFTITRGHDRRLGELFDINELQGVDWTIAIHRVSLGKPSEHRDARLRSDLDEDKHITDGCIDVDPSTIVQLSRLLPRSGMPLYILPNDENLVAALFQPTLRRLVRAAE